MSELPAPFPCWPCVSRTIQDASWMIGRSEGGGLDRLLIVECHWKDPIYRHGICTSCFMVSENCGSAPLPLEGNVKDFIDTMAYIDMAIKLKSPSRWQERIFDESLNNGKKPTEGFGLEDGVLHPRTRKDLVVATITLGTRLIEIIAEHVMTHGDRKVTPRAEMFARLSNSTQIPRLTTSNEEYLSWNGAVREFHADVLKALRPVNDHLARTIMENIPIKWIPAVDEEALEAAKMAILKADPPAQF